jgi:hypothetical protein
MLLQAGTSRRYSRSMTDRILVPAGVLERTAVCLCDGLLLDCLWGHRHREGRERGAVGDWTGVLCGSAGPTLRWPDVKCGADSDPNPQRRRRPFRAWMAASARLPRSIRRPGPSWPSHSPPHSTPTSCPVTTPSPSPRTTRSWRPNQTSRCSIGRWCQLRPPAAPSNW